MKSLRTVPLSLLVAITLLAGAPIVVQGAEQPAAATSNAHVLTRGELDKLLTQPSKVLFIDVRRPDEVSAIGGFPVYLSVQVEDLERDGVLDPQPIGGVPKVNSRANAGLYDFVLHPQYAQNQWIYFAFSKPGEGMLSATVLARAKLQGNSLTQVQELYSTEQGTNVGGSRLAFALDGKILMTTPAAGEIDKAQDPASAYGKILRLNDDGSIPRDNPFVGKSVAMYFTKSHTVEAEATLRYSLASI